MSLFQSQNCRQLPPLGRTKWFAVCLVALISSGGCATTAAVVQVQVQGLRQGEALAQTLESGTSLAAGDRLALRVTLKRPLYLYLRLRHAGDKQTQALWPEPGAPARLEEPAALRHLPGDAAWFLVTGRPGPERLLLVATTTPRTEEELLAELARWPGGREVPDTRTTGNRGGASLLQAGLNRRGAVLLRFDYVLTDTTPR